MDSTPYSQAGHQNGAWTSPMTPQGRQQQHQQQQQFHSGANGTQAPSPAPGLPLPSGQLHVHRGGSVVPPTAHLCHARPLALQVAEVREAATLCAAAPTSVVWAIEEADMMTAVLSGVICCAACRNESRSSHVFSSHVFPCGWQGHASCKLQHIQFMTREFVPTDFPIHIPP